MTKDLIEGFKIFKKHHYEGNNALMPSLVDKGQSPDYFIISCIDSRANSATIFNTTVGTFFAHKAMGAIVKPYKKGTALSAALQFAINYNTVKTIIIIGHTGCGAIKALVNGMQDEEITNFIAVAQQGLECAKKKLQSGVNHHNNLFRHAEEQIVILSRENLKTYPCVIKALEEKRIEIKCWLFEMETGTLFQLNNDTENFEPINLQQDT